MSWISRSRRQAINNDEFNQSRVGGSQAWKLPCQGTKQAAIRTIVFPVWSLSARHDCLRHLVVATCSLYRATSIRLQYLYSGLAPRHTRLLLLLLVPDEKAQSRAGNTFFLADRDGYDSRAVRAICSSATNVTRHERAGAGARHVVGGRRSDS